MYCGFDLVWWVVFLLRVSVAVIVVVVIVGFGALVFANFGCWDCGLSVCLLLVMLLGCVTCATALCCYFGCGCGSCFEFDGRCCVIWVRLSWY